MLTKRTYVAPGMSVREIKMEQCILSTANPGSLDDMDPNELYNEADQNYRGNNAVKMDKSVSEKNYSTDYTAGIVSWICVGTGVVVIIVMLVSTKITGRRASRRRV